MRIAVFHNLPYGGARRVMYEQILRLEGAVTDLYTISDDPQEPSLENVAVHTYSVTLSKLFGYPFSRLNGAVNVKNMSRMERIYRTIAADIDSRSFDLVLVHNCRVCQTPSLLRFLKTPSLYYCNEPFRALLEAPIKGGVFLPMADPMRIIYHHKAIANEAAGLACAARVLCNSYFSREAIVRHYGINAHVSYLGVDINLFSPRKVEKRNLVLSVGRLSPLKGHEFCIESLSRIDESQRPVLGIVCGPTDSNDKARVSHVADKFEVKTEFFEAITDDHLVELYNSAVAALAAPVLEPFGLVPLEAMACGTPVVAVAEGGLRETVIDGKTGFLTNRDPGEFASALKRFLNDPDLASDMGSAGRESVVANWNWDRSISALKSHIAAVKAGVA